jgi:ribosomal protein S27AE
MLPRTGPDGEIATVGSGDRARQAGFPGPLSNGDARWMALRGWKLIVPMGYQMGLAAVSPVGWLFARWMARRRRVVRVRAGLCARCGYDLRASEERCPECGEDVMLAYPGERVGWDWKNDS